MFLRFSLIIAIIAAVSSMAVRAQNTPSTAGLPSSPMTGLVGYPKNFNQAPNTTPTYYNYTRVYTPLAPMQSVPANSGLSGQPVLVNTTYSDGLGNGVMHIDRNNSGFGDVVAPAYLRASKTAISYLPFTAATNGNFVANCYSLQKAQYQSNFPTEDTTAYSKQIMGWDPVTGVPFIRNYMPGKAYVGQGRGTETKIHIYNDHSILILKENSGAICGQGTYGPGSLIKKTESDPEKMVTTYLDKNQRTICKATYDPVQSSTNYIYYVYNDLGKLTHVLPPLASHQLSSSGCLSAAIADSLCYTFKYDGKGHIVEKGTPGVRGKEYIVYDHLGRVILTQTPMLATQNYDWEFILYDKRGREAMRGVCGFFVNDSRQQLQNFVDNVTSSTSLTPSGSGLWYYVFNTFSGSSSYPASILNSEIRSINYYDDYTSSLATQTSYSHAYDQEFLQGGNTEMPAPYLFANGKLVATTRKILDPNSIGGTLVNSWINTVYYYDEEGRLIQSRTKNPWSSDWDINLQQYDFNDNIVYTVSKTHGPQGINKAKTEIRTRNIYNNLSGRLEEVKMQMDQEPWQSMQKYTYDAYGKVTQKWIGGTEEQNYTYDIGNKVKGVNESYITNPSSQFLPTMTFAEKLSYEQGFSTRRYDGKISGFQWRMPGGNISAYGYLYDHEGRLKSADFREWSNPMGTGMSWNKTARDFSVSGIGYDKNGNMLTMQQYGYNNSYQPALIDELSYSYTANTNKLASVNDGGANSPISDFDNSTGSTTQYRYDAQGNLTFDLLKGIDISYNYQNLPSLVKKGTSSVENMYDESGTLLQKKIKEPGKVTDYRYWGPFVYRNDSLLYVRTAEGRCRWVNDTSVFRYDYFVKDHLGNIRTTVTTDEQSLSTHYLATHEVASANIENLIFDNIDDVRSPNPESDQGNMEAALLNGLDGGARIGTSLLLQVMAGDKVKLQGYSYHEGKGEEDDFVMPEEMVETLINTLSEGAGGFEGGIGEDDAATTIDNMLGPNSNNYLDVYENLKQSTTDPDHPRAYLNYLFFDEEFHLIPDESRVIQVSGTANVWEQISTPDIPVQQTGHLLIYISNEQAMDVWFDNIAVTYMKGRLIEENLYYPHGLLAQSTSAIGVTVKNRQKYQSKQLQDELGMQLYDFHARPYDQQTGRFCGVDPLDQFASGYTGMGNDPANLIDPTGMQSTQAGAAMMAPPRWGDGPLGADPGESFDVYENGMYIGTIGGGGDLWSSLGSGGMGLEMQSAMMGGGGNLTIVSVNTFNASQGQNFIAKYAMGSFTVTVTPAYNNPSQQIYRPAQYNALFKPLTFNVSSMRNAMRTVADFASNGTLIPGAAMSFIDDTKAGKALAMGGGYKYMSKTQQIAAVRDLQMAGKLGKSLTRGLAVVNTLATGVAIADDIDNGMFKSAGARTAVWGAAAGAMFIPVVGWGISISIGVADAIWGDQFYNYVETNW